jgi:hypothetical protein
VGCLDIADQSATQAPSLVGALLVRVPPVAIASMCATALVGLAAHDPTGGASWRQAHKSQAPVSFQMVSSRSLADPYISLASIVNVARTCLSAD